jgi:prepilin-type N-terminal cleavage/methylation domain-containing protein
MIPARNGFTLVELLIVIAILGILAAAVMVAINPGKRAKHARDTVRLSDISQISRELEYYYVDHGTYPQEHWYDTSRGCTNTDPGGNWWEDIRFVDKWSDGECIGETLDIQLKYPIPIDPLNRDFYTYQYDAAFLNGVYTGYIIRAFFEGEGLGSYHICGGDYSYTPWMVGTCSLANPLP